MILLIKILKLVWNLGSNLSRYIFNTTRSLRMRIQKPYLLRYLDLLFYTTFSIRNLLQDHTLDARRILKYKKFRKISTKATVVITLGRSFLSKILRTGYYWPTMRKNAMVYAQKCGACQRHKSILHPPPEPIHPTISPWPFMKWEWILSVNYRRLQEERFS